MEEVISKIIKAIEDMEKTNDMSKSEKFIRVGKGKGFNVECIREDAEGSCLPLGTPLGYEVYWQVDGKDIDCYSIDVLEDREIELLRGYVGMYVE